MTDKLYLKDSYAREFEARVTAVNGNEVELDRRHSSRLGEASSATPEP